jgi:RNase P protein component
LPGEGGRKVGFAATRAVGHSVCRHRHIRKLREFYRLNKSLFPDTGHLLFLVRRTISDWPDFEARLKERLRSLRETSP